MISIVSWSWPCKCRHNLLWRPYIAFKIVWLRPNSEGGCLYYLFTSVFLSSGCVHAQKMRNPSRRFLDQHHTQRWSQYDSEVDCKKQSIPIFQPSFQDNSLQVSPSILSYLHQSFPSSHISRFSAFLKLAGPRTHTNCLLFISKDTVKL